MLPDPSAHNRLLSLIIGMTDIEIMTLLLLLLGRVNHIEVDSLIDCLVFNDMSTQKGQFVPTMGRDTVKQ